MLEELGDDLPKTIDFDVGYYEKRSSKCWLVTLEDLKQMYVKFGNNFDIPLWCDAESGQRKKGKRKRDDSEKDKDRDEDIDEVYDELYKKHGSNYTVPQLRLWARMIDCGTHESRDTPPSVPMIVGPQPKKAKKESLSDVIVDAVSAFSKAVQSPGQCTEASPGPVSVGISPGKAVDLRSKNLQQLRSLQQLYDDSILSEKEFLEQKQIILASLRKLNH